MWPYASGDWPPMWSIDQFHIYLVLAVCVIANHVASVIVDKLLSIYIRTPTEHEFKVIIQGYRDRLCFPQCGGCTGFHYIIL